MEHYKTSIEKSPETARLTFPHYKLHWKSLFTVIHYCIDDIDAIYWHTLKHAPSFMVSEFCIRHSAYNITAPLQMTISSFALMLRT